MMKNSIIAIKDIISMILCGFSTFSLFPTTDYGKHIPKTPAEAIAEAWYITGQNMQQAMNKVQVVYERSTK